MYLALDTSSQTTITLFYYGDDLWQRRDFSITEGTTLLKCLETLFAELGLSPTHLAGLLVVVGQGRFTATRVAVTVGNTLAYAYQIPIKAIMNSGELDEALIILRSQPVGRYIRALYSGEARIGHKAVV